MAQRIIEGVDYIKFLGTAGARFVMIKQLRASGGLWISSGNVKVLIDPGPGCLVRCAASRPKLDPGSLDAIIITHRHLDHCNDVNVMIEAMTEGGFKKRGTVFCPQDALEGDPVIFKYIRNFPDRIEVLKENHEYSVGDFNFQTSMKHIHPVETYGLKFRLNKKTVGLLTDTGYFPDLNNFYKTDLLIIGVVFLKPRPDIAHLNFQDVERLASEIKPQKTVLTHFGMSMLAARPHELAESLAVKLKQDIIAAYDGMVIVP
ncbi:MAG: MBL fold metallo-hydrolase [Candidatus Omnitrophica bacterium]|nr:MBL fold metallo-hydrolase [Candidatus Omnitrophota bacterium]